MHFFKNYVITYEEASKNVDEIYSLKPLTQALADHMREQGKPIPSDEELISQAKSLLSFFEILIKAERENTAWY